VRIVSGWQLRKSKSFLGGLIRLTGTRRGVGTLIGVRGFRLSRSPGGQVTASESLPGTGLFRRRRVR
jgi:hypothetical protein